MPPEPMLESLVKAAFGRKTTQGKMNKLIDAFLEKNFTADEAAHFVNEVLIHNHPKQHIHNTIKYGINPRLGKMLLKAASKMMK